MEYRVIFVFWAGILTVMFDSLFHYFFTSPMEIAPYFVAIFFYALVACAIALFVFDLAWHGILISGAIFVSLKAIEYYFVYIYRLYSLAVYPPTIIRGLSNSSLYDFLGYPVRSTDLGFLVVHFLAFVGALFLVKILFGLKGSKNFQFRRK